MPDPSYPHSYGAYVLLEHLGRGGMADVDLARRTVDDAQFVRFVVIKRIQTKLADDKAFIRMFTDEARISAELQQENIAQVYDFGQVGEEYFLAMEYVPGINLRQVQRILAGRGQVPPFRVTFRVLADVLSALQYAHSRLDTYGRPMNLVHRDVNPRNVMLSVRGEVKLIDFGVAKADIRTEQTVGKSMKGKFAYMAPEQVETGVPVDGRADLYAVGLVLHELVEGRSPFAGLNEAQIVNTTLRGIVPPLKVPALFPDAALLRAIHDKALARNPDERYPDAAAFRDDLTRAAALVGGLSSREEMAEFLRKVAPEDVIRITERLKIYRSMPPMPSPVAPPTPPPAPPTPPPIAPAAPEPAPPAPALAESATLPPTVPPFQPDRRLVLGVALGALALLVGLLFGRLVLKGRIGVAPPPSEASLSATEAASPTPAPEAAPAPAPASATAPLSPPPTTETAPVAPTPPTPGSKRPRTPVTAPSTTPLVEPELSPTATAASAATGFLNVSSSPARGYDVYVDGEAVGKTPLKGYRLPPGRYQVVVKDVDSGLSWERTAVVTANTTAVVTTGS